MLFCFPERDFFPTNLQEAAPGAQKQLVSLSNLSPAGVFSLNVPVEALFFVGNQLIATSHTGKVGVWNAVTKHWQVGGDALPLDFG